MKTIFGSIIESEDDNFFNRQKSLYEKISNTFNEFYIINLIHFTLFKKKNIYNCDYLNTIKLPHNFKIITPVNENELNKFLINKKLVAFMLFGKRLNSFRIQYLVKKYKIRLIYMYNLSVMGEHYLGKTLLRKREIKIHKYYFFRFKRIIVHYLFRILTILNVFPKIDIYFESTKGIVNNCNNSLTKKIEKIFPFLKISYFGKVIHINSRSFDMLTKVKSSLSEEKIVFIDLNYNHIIRTSRDEIIDEKLRLQYFNQLTQFLLELSNIFNKKVTICLHPTSDLNTYKKYLGIFEICKFQTSENIRQAFIVVFHQSTIIADAIFLKKKIISLKSNSLGEYNTDRINFFQKKYGLFSYSLDEKKELNKDLLETQLKKITMSYDRYIKEELMADDPILGEDKIINTVKKEYFENNMYF
jgi:hypothetical protein